MASKFDGLDKAPVFSEETPLPRPEAVVKPARPKSKFEGLDTAPTPQPTNSKFAGLAEAPGETPVPTEEEKAPGQVMLKDIEEIGKKHDLSFEQIKELYDMRPYLGQMGGTTITPANIAKQVAGFAGKSVGMGIPQWIYKITQDDPKMKSAIDDLNEKISAQKGYIQAGSEMLLGLSGALKLGGVAQKTLGGAAKYYDRASAISSVATQSVADSKTGEELEAGLKGAGMAAGFVVGAPLVGKAVVKGYKVLRDVPLRILNDGIEETKKIAPQIDKAISEARVKQKVRIDAIKEALESGKLDFTDNDKLAESIPEDILNRLAPRREVTKKLKDSKSLKEAVGEDLPPELAFKKAQKIIASTRIRDTAEQTVKLLGETRGLDDLIKHKPKYFKNLLEKSADFFSESIDKAIDVQIANKVIPKIDQVGWLKQFGPFRIAANFVADFKFLSKTFDDRLGLTGNNSLERILDTGSKKLNLYATAIRKPLTTISRLVRETRRAGVEQEELWEKLNSGVGLDDTALKFKDMFSELVGWAQDMGLKIHKMENYVPHLRLPYVEYRAAFKTQVENMLKRIGKPLEKLDKEDFKKLLADKDSKLVTELETLSGVDITSVDMFQRQLIKLIKNPSQLNDSLKSAAFAMAERTGGIPVWALDKNVGRLASRWVQATAKHAAIRQTMRDLNAYAAIAEKTGQVQIAKQVRTLGHDLIGRRQGSYTVEEAAATLIEAASNTKSPLMKKFYKGGVEVLEWLPIVGQQVYPNLLGGNVKSMSQNAASFFYQGVPELGVEIGPRVAFGAMGDVAGFLRKGGSVSELLEKEGILPTQWTAEMVEAVRFGVNQSVVKDLAIQATDKSTNALMYFFNKSEQLARIQTHFAAKRTAALIINDTELKKGFLTRISSGTYRNLIGEAVEQGNEKLAAELVDDYFQSTYLFNYDKLNMSEYGRTLGPLFSVFSKWPTATVGKILHYYASENPKSASMRMFQTLLAPYGLAQLWDNLAAPEDGESMVYDKVVGRKGMSGWVQLDSLPFDTSVKDGLLASPGPKALSDLREALASGEDAPEKMRKWTNNTFNTFGFGAGWLRVFSKDIPELVTGEKQDRFELIPE